MAAEADGVPHALSTLEMAMGDRREELVRLSPAPVAAASLAEVYRGSMSDGTDVAVKIQRPGLERRVALDLFVMRRSLQLVQQLFQIGDDVEVVVAVLDEVGLQPPPPHPDPTLPPP